MIETDALLIRNLPTPVQQIHETFFEDKGVRIFIKRDDLIHPEISGNKWRKLKYNLREAQRQQHDTVLTFGGAYSNHIAATAAACRLAGMKSIGIIRGDELNERKNPTLLKAAENGMSLLFIPRKDYRKKTEADFIAFLHGKFGDFFLIPEGGCNELGVEGCAEIMQEANEHFDFICAACGTGTTLAGILSAIQPGQKALGFPALKDSKFLENILLQFLGLKKNALNSYQLITNYHFGGYARQTPELLGFIKVFKEKHGIELDFIYTGKMLYGIYDLIKSGFFPEGTKILVIHTGGLQGNQSLESLTRGDLSSPN